jgi:tetratricopeptide (TPR) repeat protein
MAISAVNAQETKTESEKNAKNEDTVSSRLNSLQDDSSVNPRADAIRVIDQMIAICNRMGDKENAALAQTLRDRFATNSEERIAIHICDNSIAMLKELRKCNELLTADELTRSMLCLASCIMKESPRVFVGAHLQAARLDIEFERYDSALKHTALAQQVAIDEHLGRHVSAALGSTDASVFRKLGQFDKAEQIYSELLKQADDKSDSLSEDDLYNLRFARAALYAEKGEFKKYVDAFPADERKITDEDGNRDYGTELIKANAIVNYNLTVDGKIDVAADKALQTVDHTKQYYGASSRRHIEAIELLAKVRIAQDRNNDAIALLKQSADLREKLLGKDHESIARIHKEIDSIKK